MSNRRKKEDGTGPDGARTKPGPPRDARPVIRKTMPLPVTLTEARCAVLGAELADLNQTHRDLQEAKKRAAKSYKDEIAKVETRSIPIEEALKKAEETKRAGIEKPLVVPLSVAVELRPVAGSSDEYEVYRMDTDPPRWISNVRLPRSAEQQGLPFPGDGGGNSTDPARAEEEKAIDESLRQQLASVSFPEDEEDGPTAPPDGGTDDDGDEEDPLG